MIEERLTAVVTEAVEALVHRLDARLQRLEALATKTPATPRLLYREAEAAEMLGIAAASLKQWRCKGLVKSHTPHGARVPLYSWEELQKIVTFLAEAK